MSGGATPVTLKRKRRFSQSDAHYIEHVRKKLGLERHDGIRRHDHDVNSRAAYLLGVSRASVGRVMKNGVESFPADTTPEIRQREGEVEKEHIMAVKEAYITYVTEKRRRPTYRQLFASVTADENWPFGMTTLFNQLKKIGFVERRKRNYDDVTHANPAFVLQRQRYLEMIEAARAEGRKIYYQDESWINAHMQRHKEMQMPEWGEGLDASIPDPKSGKGARSILCGIGSADDSNGFLDGSFLLYRGRHSNKSDDYHTDMNSDVFLDWMKTSVMPKMPKRPAKATIVIDRASYHMVRTEATHMPSSTSKKSDLVDWLEKKGVRIPVPGTDPDSRRPQLVEYRIARKKGRECMGVTKRYLWELVKKNKIPPRYKVVKLVESFPNTDVTVIFLPVHHPELNPIELMWNQIKSYVRSNNVGLNQAAAEDLVREKVAVLDQESWQKCLKHVLKVEEAYKKEQLLEDEDEIEIECENEEEE